MTTFQDQRRSFVAAAAGALLLPAVRADDAQQAFARAVRAIEQRCGGRLGVFLHDTGSARRFAWRADERFAMASTFKALLAGAVLARVDRGAEQLERRIAITAADRMAYAPVTGPRIDGEPMTVAELCAAAVAWSDNTAANLLLRSVGGPAGLTRWLRSTGDTVTRLDRWEPELNEARAGDPRDTSSPRAFGTTVQKLVLGDVLSPASREQLSRWLLGNKVGDARLRALLPAGWRVGDKTGTGSHGTTNDAGLLWPPDRPPIIAAVFLTGSSADGPARERAIAEVGRLAASLAG